MRTIRASGILGLVALLLVLGGGWCHAEDQEGCLLCHGLRGFGYQGEAGFRALSVEPEDYELSRHGALSCRGCHRDVVSVPHHEDAAGVNCGLDCHAVDASGEKPYSHETLYWSYMASVHGTSPSAALDCLGCHPQDLSQATPRRAGIERVRVCGRCHLVPAPGEPSAPDPGQRHDYYGDAHGRQAASGHRWAPACPDCHTEHVVLPSENEESSTGTKNLPATCAGERASLSGACHREAASADLAGASPLPLQEGRKSPGTVLALLLAGLVGVRALGGLVPRR